MEQILKQTLDVVRYSCSIGIALNNTEGLTFDGKTARINSKNLLNFSLCDYLGLSNDIRIRKAAAKACMDNGVYTAISRTFLKLGIYKEAENLVSQIFQKPVLITQRTTMGHIAALPVLIGKNDAMILDHQVHASVKLGSRLASQHALTDIIRHSRMDILEEKIIELSKTHEKVWYLADGIYSMYGDAAPVEELVALLEKYPQFHLYVDDAHGMSWAGERGSGFFLAKAGKYPDRLFLVTSLGKGFGAGAGVLVCPNEEFRQTIEILGAPLMFSSPVEPATLGAIIKSAEIHLSDEIYDMQSELKQRVFYMVRKAMELELPVMGQKHSPIIFVASGKPDMTSDICRGMMDHGYYVTGGVFPAVPFNNSGIRIVVTLNQNFDEIERMLHALKFEYNKALKTRNISLYDILKTYKGVDFQEANTQPSLY